MNTQNPDYIKFNNLYLAIESGCAEMTDELFTVLFNYLWSFSDPETDPIYKFWSDEIYKLRS